MLDGVNVASLGWMAEVTLQLAQTAWVDRGRSYRRVGERAVAATTG
jgi:hypothetical protein